MKWDVFTLEDQKIIHEIMARKDWDSLAHAIRIDTLEKEYWIAELLKEHRPVGAPLESKVRAELEKFEIDGGRITTPEEEAAWQKRIDEEQAEYAAKVKGTVAVEEKLEVAEPTPAPEVVQEPSTNEILPTPEPVVAPKRRGRPKKQQPVEEVVEPTITNN